MKYVVWAMLLGVAIFACTPNAGVVAQDTNEEDEAAVVDEYVAKARRLRDFGYPLLARDQLDLAKALDPTDKGVLLGYVRLFTLADAEEVPTQPYVQALLNLYPHDYDACLELARFISYTDPQPTPPSTKTPQDLATGLARLKAEMAVFRELGAFINKPSEELPESAKGKPYLPLAYLARAEKETSGTHVVAELAASDLARRGDRFDAWARTDEKLTEPFGNAAKELYELALPLYRRVAKSEDFGARANISIANLQYRLGNFDEAMKAITVAEMLAPFNETTPRILLNIAEEIRDIDALVEANEKLHQVYAELTTALDLSASKRVRDQKWKFEFWIAFREMQEFSGVDRAAAIRELLRVKPEFLEVQYYDAMLARELAYEASDRTDRRLFFEKSLDALSKCEALATEMTDWYRLRAGILWEQGKFKQAAEVYTTLAKVDDRDTEAAKHAAAAQDIAEGLYTARDYALYRQQLEYGSVGEKVKILKQLVGRSPNFFGAQHLLGEAAYMLGEFEVAYNAYLAAHKLRPENLEAMHGAAHAAIWSERYDEAVGLLAALKDAADNYKGTRYWFSLIKEVAAGDDNRQRAFRLWLQSTSGQTNEVEQRRLLEEAVNYDSEFPEVLIGLAAINRRKQPQAARNWIELALAKARDDSVRAAAHRERGQLELSQNEFQRAATEFKTAYSYDQGDGSSLLLAALALRRLEDWENAAATMRKLFNENPGTGMLRPRPGDVNELNLLPVESLGPVNLHPAYDVGDKLNFHVEITTSIEGQGYDGTPHTVEFSLKAEVLERPRHTGLWKLKVSFANAPPGFAALNNLELDIQVSPWFGLIESPPTGGLGQIADPALQAVVEAFTVGLGDASVSSPYVWKNDLTQGPPHLGGDSIEGACLSERMGDSMLVIRRALAGRRLGNTGMEEQQTFAKGLETRVHLNGPRHSITSIEFEIARKELTREKDDVLSQRLNVLLTAD